MMMVMMVMMAVMMMVIWSWYFHQRMKKRAGALSTLSWQEWNVTSFNIWYRYQLASLGKRLKQEIYFEYLTNIFSTIHVATVLYDIFLSQQWAIILIRPRRRWSWERIFVRSWRVSKDFISNEIFCWNAESSLVNTLKTPTSLRGNRIMARWWLRLRSCVNFSCINSQKVGFMLLLIINIIFFLRVPFMNVHCDLCIPSWHFLFGNCIWSLHNGV